MTASLRALVDGLRREALAMPSFRFRKAQSRQPVLLPYPDVAAVLEALADDREQTYPERDALTRALLDEHHRGGEPRWASALLAAYYPMLSRLRFRLVSDTVPRDELDQLVVTSFLAVIHELPGGKTDRVAMRLRQRTERIVFAFLRKEHEHHRASVDHDDSATPPVETPQVRRSSETDEKMFDLAMLLDRTEEHKLSQASIEVIAATVLRRERLRSYVQRVAPKDPSEQERIYQRLKRKRSRALKRLRSLLGVSPVSAASGF